MITTRALVLSSIKFQDTSLIVRCYTQEGVRSYLLKGVLNQLILSLLHNLKLLQQKKIMENLSI